MIDIERLRSLVQGVGRAYKLTFANPHVDGCTRVVLADLARFCHAAATTTNEREVGRREVWLRISEHLHLTEEELVGLYKHRLGD